MQAIVFANRCGKELSPLNEFYCPAMLPILGKPVLEHCMDELKLNKVKEVFLVISSSQKAIKDYFQQGLRWSLTIHYIICENSDTPNKIKEKLAPTLKLPYYVARGDIVRGTYDWNLPNERESTAYVNLLNKPLGLIKVNDKSCSIDCIDWPLKKPEKIDVVQINCPLKNYLIHTLSSYHQLVLTEANHPQTFIASGIEQSLNLITGKRSLIQSNSLSNGKTYIGDHSYVDKSAKLYGQTSIGHECIVDRGVKVSNSIILDDTYIGAEVEIKNAIVCQNKIIRIDLATCLTVSSTYTISKNKANKESNLSIFNLYNIALRVLRSSRLSCS
ncbi:NDP-sugar synthase [Zooshikella marina]|uniref:nucleotidyltransferase family protein n=1 Tax=Zooshikella ganghwensis TaxID=202772 RepID=UPI001BAE7C57|nr:NDP-sugar synthase [Zooshikella ganghwensis]MBU2708915.1 NDP-sugar synthase [Zooshikella ganghwensis]